MMLQKNVILLLRLVIFFVEGNTVLFSRALLWFIIEAIDALPCQLPCMTFKATKEVWVRPTPSSRRCEIQPIMHKSTNGLT